MNSKVIRVRPLCSWGATAVACTLVGAGAAVGVMTSNGVAHAADVNVVTDASIKNTSHPNGPNNVFDSFSAVFSFDTTGKTVAENDTLTIKLPKELRTRQASFDVTDAQTGGVALRCSVPSGEGPELTCIFTDYMKTHENARGQIHLVGETAAESSSENLSFTVNHTVTLPVPMPNGKIVPKANAHAPATAYKDGWQLHNGHDERFTWEVYIPERQNHASTISVTDTFDPANGGYRLFNDPNGAWQRTRLLKWNSLEDFQNDPKRENFAEKVDVGGSINGGTFTMTETANGFVASFPNSGGDAYYLLKYYTELKVPASASVGSAFKNTAVVNEQVAEKSIVINTAGWGDVDADKKKTPTPTPSTTTPSPTPSTTTPTPSPTPSTTTPTPSPTPSTTTPTPSPTPSTTTPTPTPSTTTPTPEPTPSTTTPEPEPTPSTTTPEPEPSVSTSTEAPKVLAHTGANAAIVLLVGAFAGTLGAMLSRRRAQ
ncbi:Ig-like domain-containing protein [uncultured Actinomyces sp.]|uniref:Ig-like domain-containing protein n=1 Tax=uncultured Actinomyces sp. TaxID=249061 RepID=UPI0028D43E19|nr:Ig-like domain-containing protein [uncultured Actinomyces sp.]